MEIKKMSNFCSYNGMKNDKILCGFMVVNAYVSRVYIVRLKYRKM